VGRAEEVNEAVKLFFYFLKFGKEVLIEFWGYIIDVL
jgi:hypothetical protein